MDNCNGVQNNYSGSASNLMYGLTNQLFTIRNRAIYKTDYLLGVFEMAHIDSHTKFMMSNNQALLRLLDINKQEKNITHTMLGDDAHANGLSDSYAKNITKPEYVAGNNYLEFAETLKTKEEVGGLTTRQTLINDDKNINSFNNYKNLYPNEINSISVNETWNVGCETNSILYKTQKLFNEKKINTIISRFGTNADGDGGGNIQYNGQVRTSFGESRGRNLLTKDAEENGNGYNINGYKNPYCRTWTNHYKYDSLCKTMRPFSKMENGQYHSHKSLKDTNNWNNFQKHKLGKREWGWRNDNTYYDKSVMSDGLISFAPMYRNGGESNIHTRQCMFSIENLAWKDYNPYSFENCLSWEQRGPNGGRIMWFPPYGLTFNETTQARWQAHQFIGRGEEVYTYQDTVRSGTLSFLIVVDHPSIIDYVFGKHNKNASKIKDNDVHRYFAGCDDDTLKNTAQPTPLTDEYEAFIEYGKVDKHADMMTKKMQKDESKPQSTPEKIIFSCFFPNNYSGYYDNNTFNYDPEKVSSMKYLLTGIGSGSVITCYKNSNDEECDCSETDHWWEESNDESSVYNSQIDYSDIINGDPSYFDYGYDEKLSTGYCMGKPTPKNLDKKYLLPQIYPRFLSRKKATPTYSYDTAGQGWFYRIDHKYRSIETPTGEERYKNTQDQTCNGIRRVTQNYDYNVISPLKTDNENEKHYSFLQMCCAVFDKMEYTGNVEFLQSLYPQALNSEDENSDYAQLLKIFKKIKYKEITIKKITAKGYSSGRQKGTTAGNKRNEYLAKQRAEMIKTLFQSANITDSNIEISIEKNPSSGKIGKDENDKTETMNRRAELIIELANETTKSIVDEEDNIIKKLDEAQIQDIGQGNNNSSTNTEEELKKYNEENKYIGYKKTDRKVEVGGKRYFLYKEITSTNNNEERFWFNIDDWIGKEDETQVVDTTEEDAKKQAEEDAKNKKVLDEIEKEIAKAGKTPILVTHSAAEGKKDRVKISCEVNKYVEIEFRITARNLLANSYVTISKADDVDNSNLFEIKNPSDGKFELDDKGNLNTNNIVKIRFSPTRIGRYNGQINIKASGTSGSEAKSIMFIIIATAIANKEEEKKKKEAAQATSWRLYNDDIIKSGKFAGIQTRKRDNESNFLRYDQEYYFFKKLEVADPITYENLVQKLQYFDPTFHSMTPEGFNGRLTFLQQCMRQGDTVTKLDHVKAEGSDKVVTAKNLAFGRPPFCILRIGDFYNQTIIIENLSINYDFDGGVKWDLNSEGIGVQPLLAQVQLNIKLIGGGDMSGPIRRLQNAMSFNYYANTSLYDNRADRYEYEIDSKTAQKGELKKENCWVYDAFTKTEGINWVEIETDKESKLKDQIDSDIKFGANIGLQKGSNNVATKIQETEWFYNNSEGSVKKI